MTAHDVSHLFDTQIRISVTQTNTREFLVVRVNVVTFNRIKSMVNNLVSERTSSIVKNGHLNKTSIVIRNVIGCVFS